MVYKLGNIKLSQEYLICFTAHCVFETCCQLLLPSVYVYVLETWLLDHAVDCLLSIIISLAVYVYVLETFKALGAPGAPLYIHTGAVPATILDKSLPIFF